MHMLRNAVDHGIEPPDERQALGKPPAGTIRVSAAQRGGVIEIDLRDDGAGLDPSHLRATAVKRGILAPEQAATLDDAASAELIFRPGFTTTTTVTDISGRGVGMDVVREHLEHLSGLIEVDSTPGEGTRFTPRVPLTLATSRTLLVEQGEQRFAIPSPMVERTGRVRESALATLEGRRAITIEGHPVMAVELANVLERPLSEPDPRREDEWRPYLVLCQGERRVALLVGEQGIVVKSLDWPLRRVRNVGGATVLGSGEVVVILNPTDLLKSALRLQQASGAVTMVAQPERRRHRLLVVDDSLTTRTLLGSILEAAGYDVAVAMDGVEALSILRDRPTDLVVSDVEMPRLDGFNLTAEIRRDEQLHQTPVILVTSLAAPEHRERGVAVGADAYIVKSGFDQADLLEAIRRLL
jgi:two-component system chemotaxis sensor kinase CheA